MKHFYKNIKLNIPANIYEPKEDTHLLLDTVKSVKNKNILEIGTGSGLISIYLSKNNKVTATDINKKALKTAKQNAKTNNVKINFIHSDLFSNINNKFDIILFNLPYLPKSREDKHAKETRDYTISKDKIKEFIKQFPKYLNKHGSCFILFSSITPSDFIFSLLKENNYNYKIINKKKIEWETLYATEIEVVDKV